MTAFVVRDATHLGADRIATSTTAFALYENLKAVLEKDSTAVAAGWVLANNYVVSAMITAGAVTEVKLGSASVAAGKLKTSTGEVSTTAGSPTNLVLPGGAFGFYPRLRSTNVRFSVRGSVRPAKKVPNRPTNTMAIYTGAPTSACHDGKFIVPPAPNS